MPTVLLTRPEGDSADLADRLAALGIDSIAAPVMDVVIAPGPMLGLGGVAGFLATSANGVKALACRTDARTLPLFAVGDATARAAAAAGFADVRSAGGDVDDLAALVMATQNPAAGALLHAAGSVTAGDLAGALGAAGFTVRREHLYDARPRSALSAPAAAALSAGAVDGVAIYSPRSARLFDGLIENAGLTQRLSDVDLFALSENVAAASRAPWARRHIAARPDQESLLHLLRTCYV